MHTDELAECSAAWDLKQLAPSPSKKIRGSKNAYLLHEAV
jgi:hypothetical protein